jgi:hypothetical protein
MNYEPQSIANHLQTDAGEGFGISRSVSPVWRDWYQQFETKAKTYRVSADAGDTAGDHPWTLQHLFEHCRGEYPFLVVEGFNESSSIEVFALRTEGTPFVPQRAAPAWDAYFHVPFRCSVIGQVTS